MIYCLIKFNSQIKKNKSKFEDLIETYLSTLLHNGQIYDDYSLTWIDGVLCAHTFLARPGSLKKRYTSKWGLDNLAKIESQFKVNLEWKIIDDDIKKKYCHWKSAKFLYLQPHAFNVCSPIFRGNDGCSIPPYLIPITDKDREYLFFWARSYYHHDNIWIGSGELEIPAYKQLADPFSELSESGRDYAELIEKSTGIPTYYYLMRYWGRKIGEENRLCPLCGKDWKTNQNKPKVEKFWHFHFMCNNCRLVSHEADSYDDERHARIGEYNKKKAMRNRTNG